MNFEDWQPYLVVTIQGSANWRAQKAAEYPDDGRNLESSRSLQSLADKLERLPADHPKLHGSWWALFKQLPGDKEADLLTATEFESRLISRYGFDRPDDGDPERFLDELIKIYKEEVS